MNELNKIEASFPDKTRFMFYPHRYKAMYGGRGGGKSYAAARALLLLGIAEKHRILCAREVQRTIKDSVHKLLSDQIKELGLEEHYEVLQTEIRGSNGTEFIFSGLADQTVASIKSLEGCTRVWCEEAQNISKRSWDILIPTIREIGSEIWVTFNPELESDATYQKFVVDPPPDCVSVKINWRDNPWFNEVLEKERLHCKATNPDGYPNIWEGECKPAVEGAIFFKEIQAMERQGRICNVPYDPMLRVHIVSDIGGDALTAALVQRQSSEIRIIEYIEVHQTTLDVFSSILRQRPYNWGRWWPPHDAHSKHLAANLLSTAYKLKALGWDVATRDEITEQSIEEGIKTTRMAMSRIYIDKTKCAAPQPVRPPGDVSYSELSWRLVEALKRYRRHENRHTGGFGMPVRDPYIHAADTMRYIALNERNMLNADQRPDMYMPEATYQPIDREVGM